MASDPTENPTREQCAFLAKLAEQAGRYDDMAEIMQKLVRSTAPASGLTAEERGLVSASFKKATGSIRGACRIVAAVERRHKSRGNEEGAAAARAYRSSLESKLSRACGDVLELLERHLLPSAARGEPRALYLKMRGDYSRYLAESKDGNERMASAEITLASYEEAQEIAHADLEPTNPIRLGLALNFSVFYYEFLNLADKAQGLAKQAIEEAMAEVVTREEETYKDSVLIVELLKDNLKLWTSDSKDQIDEV